MRFDKPHIMCLNDGTFVGYTAGWRKADPPCQSHLFSSGPSQSLWRCFNLLRLGIMAESYAWLADFDHQWPINRADIRAACLGDTP